MDDSCAVCAETLEWVAYGGCGHKDVCSTCVARLRFICDDHRCCICKTESAIVFITKALGDYTKSIGDFSVLPSEAKEGRVGQYWYHEDTQAFFDDVDHYKMIKAMCNLSCSVCQKMEDLQDDASRRMAKFRSIEQLKGHLFHKHKLVMCSLCLEGRKVFICEQKLYTRPQLTQHINTGDSEVDGTESERGGFAGHPTCEFCRTPFYGDNELYTHMSTEHYTCHICQRQHPGQYEYYKNYDDLEIHFRRDHFLCEDENCLGKKFIVFQAEAELKRHSTLEHGGHMSRSKRSAALQIPTSFRYRRSVEQESRRGRGQIFFRDSADGELSLAIQASLDIMGATPSNSRAITNNGEVESLIPSLESVATSDSELPSRYMQALSSSSRNGTLGESSFPPLPVAPGNNQSSVNAIPKNTMAAHLRRQSKKKGKSSSSAPVWGTASRAPVQQVVDPRAWPSIKAVSGSTSRSGQGKAVPDIGSAASSNSTSAQTRSPLTSNSSFAGSLIPSKTGTKGRMSHSSSAPNLSERQSLESSSSSFPTVQAALAAKTPVADKDFKKVEDVRTANKSLVEKMRDALGDEDKFAAFKVISGEYRQGSMDAETYLAYVEQFGLSHLVPEMARLLPDAQKQKELTEAYNVNMAFGTLEDNGWVGQIKGVTSSKKGKGKLLDSSSNTVKDKLADNVISTVKELQSSYKAPEEEVEVLSKDGYRDARGKSKVSLSDSEKLKNPIESLPTSSASNQSSRNVGDGKSKQRKKTSKFHRVRLGDGSVEALLDIKNSDPDPDPGPNDNKPSSNGPNRSVWRNGGGQKLLTMTSQAPKKRF